MLLITVKFLEERIVIVNLALNKGSSKHGNTRRAYAGYEKKKIQDKNQREVGPTLN